jgi:hypothetical protein
LVDTKLKLFKATLKRKIKTKSIEVEEIEEIPTVKAFIWSSSATATCFIGFVSNVFQVLYGDALDGRVVDVVHIGKTSFVEADRRRSKEHNGLVIGRIIG